MQEKGKGLKGLALIIMVCFHEKGIEPMENIEVNSIVRKLKKNQVLIQDKEAAGATSVNKIKQVNGHAGHSSWGLENIQLKIADGLHLKWLLSKWFNLRL